MLEIKIGTQILAPVPPRELPRQKTILRLSSALARLEIKTGTQILVPAPPRELPRQVVIVSETQGYVHAKNSHNQEV